MATPIARLQAIATALDLCHLCEHRIAGQPVDTPPSTPAPLPIADDEEEHHRPVNDMSYQRCILTSVRIVDCNMEAFTARDSSFENVLFRQCSFSNVFFDGVKLKNVTFFNVHFQNVRLNSVRQSTFGRRAVAPIELTDALWMQEGLRNAHIYGDMFKHISGSTTTIALRLKGETQLSRTTWFEPPAAKNGALEDPSERRSINVIAKPQVGIFELPNVRSNIMSHLFPCPRRMHGSTMVMADRPAFEPGRVSAQTQYRIQSPFGFGKTSSPAQTYHGWSRPVVEGVRQGLTPLRFSTELLRASKAFYELAITHVYDRGFVFESAERCLAFLHDHQKPEHQLSGLGLKLTSQTNPAAWRRLFNVLVHERRDIKELVLDIGAEFWDTGQARKPAVEAVGWKGWTNAWKLDKAIDGQRSFLQHVARLPGRRLSNGKVPGKAEDIRFFLRITGSKGVREREAFVDELQSHLRVMMLNRRELDVKDRRVCCQIKQLEDCCYWQRPASDT